MKKILKEPLLHFLAAGMVIFFCYSLVSPRGSADDPHEISVGRSDLLSYLQFRSRVFDQEKFEKMLDSMDDNEREQLVSDYVKEEALYREAKSMQLDKNDYVSRMRLIQQLKYIVNGFVSQEVDLSRENVESYYAAHKGDYYLNPKVTFTHVFISAEERGWEQAGKVAKELEKQMNREGIAFNEATSFGDRFLYRVNYVEKGKGEISSHFGEEMTDQLFSMSPDAHRWQGPLQSPYGYHVVMLTRHTEGRQPSLEQIYDQVARDARQARMNEKIESAIQSIVKTYQVDRKDLSPDGEKS